MALTVILQSYELRPCRMSAIKKSRHFSSRLEIVLIQKLKNYNITLTFPSLDNIGNADTIFFHCDFTEGVVILVELFKDVNLIDQYLQLK